MRLASSSICARVAPASDDSARPTASSVKRRAHAMCCTLSGLLSKIPSSQKWANEVSPAERWASAIASWTSEDVTLASRRSTICRMSERQIIFAK